MSIFGVSSKKCLVIDCYNVLWREILSEDGIENIRLGDFSREYLDTQCCLLSLYYHGIILTISSKNNLDDVMKVFRKHSIMGLREKHIACFQINWNKKSSSIKKFAEYLNIGLDSIVFIDDYPFEIEAVRLILPEVTALLFDYKFIYKDLSCLNISGRINIHDTLKRQKT